MKKLTPDSAAGFEERRFGELFAIALAGGQSAPAGADDESVDFVRPSGELVRLPDAPMHRAAFALKRELAQEQSQFLSALWRFEAVMHLYSKGTLRPYTRIGETGGDSFALHPAVLDVAASARLSKNGKFAPRRFLADIDALIATRYADFSW